MAEVINKAFTLLRLMKPSENCKEWSASELARLSGYPLGTTHRILQVLEENGVVQQNKENKKFRLGLALIEFGHLAGSLYSIRDRARPYMEKLSSATKETVYLSILTENLSGILIDSIDSTHSLRLVEPIGLNFPLYVGAGGKAILAFLNDETQEELIRSFTWEAWTENTITDEQTLRKEIAWIRKNGYAISRGETSIGTIGFAAPVFGSNGVEASLAITGPEIRITDDIKPFLVKGLLEKTRELSLAIGGQWWLQKFFGHP